MGDRSKPWEIAADLEKAWMAVHDARAALDAIHYSAIGEVEAIPGTERIDSDMVSALRSPAPPCPKCGGVGQFEVLQPTVGASRIEVCDQCVGRSPAPVVDGKPCTVCKGSDPDCRWGGVPANCSMWGKDFPEATRPQPAQGEAFAWVDDLSWHQQAKRAVMASVKLGSWMSAALDDVAVCEAMKADIREWFSAGEPMEILTAAITALRQHSGESALREENARLREALKPFARMAESRRPPTHKTACVFVEDLRKARAALGGGGEA